MARCINPDEVRRHQKKLQELVQSFLQQVGMEGPGECYKSFVTNLKTEVSKVVSEVRGEAKWM